MESQKDWRRQTLVARDRLSTSEVADKSAAIIEQLFRLNEFRKCRSVMFFASFRSEVETGAAISRCLELGVVVALPLAIPASRRLEPRLVSNPASQLRSGYCGILEPDPEHTKIMDPKELEVVVVPGSVFDLQGGRIGYGGGFYDRFLQMEAPQALRIGLAFALQVRSEPLTLADHDQRLDLLVTEERVNVCRRR